MSPEKRLDEVELLWKEVYNTFHDDEALWNQYRADVRYLDDGVGQLLKAGLTKGAQITFGKKIDLLIAAIGVFEDKIKLNYIRRRLRKIKEHSEKLLDRAAA
tara:strand:- start:5599 stop:5904 length:306 start_codon:yes stop_codon:yes gene_type:complete